MSSTRKGKQLRDCYQFAGFTPSVAVKGVFGDSQARVITLTRRSKKQFVAYAVVCIVVGMIASCGACVINPAAMRVFIWSMSAVVCTAKRVKQ